MFFFRIVCWWRGEHSYNTVKRPVNAEGVRVYLDEMIRPSFWSYEPRSRLRSAWIPVNVWNRKTTTRATGSNWSPS